MDAIKVEDAARAERFGRHRTSADGEGEIGSGKLNVGGTEEHVIDMAIIDGGAIEVEGHEAGGIGRIAVRGVQRAVLDGRERIDLDAFGNSFSG